MADGYFTFPAVTTAGTGWIEWKVSYDSDDTVHCNCCSCRKEKEKMGKSIYLPEIVGDAFEKTKDAREVSKAYENDTATVVNAVVGIILELDENVRNTLLAKAKEINAKREKTNS